MMEYVHSMRMSNSNATYKSAIKISVELEKIRPYPMLEQLIPFADVIFLSKDFARSKGIKIRCQPIYKWVGSQTNAYKFLENNIPICLAMLGWHSMEKAVDGVQTEFEVPNACVICLWAEKVCCSCFCAHS